MRRSWALLLLTVLALAARLLLVGLPSLGRDEAAYLYWSRHPEPAYSPLLQFLLRLFDWLPGDAAWVLRLPAVLGGILALVLVRQLSEGRDKALMLALLVSPWWVYASSVIHPDALLLPALLLLFWAHRRGRALTLAAGCVLAAWAKPSGLLALPVGCLLLLSAQLGSRSRRLLAASLAMAGTAIVLPILRPEIFSALREFASADPRVGLHWRILLGLAALFFLPGPALLFRAVRRVRPTREALLPAAYLAAFAFAAVAWGQFKLNWFLPALVLAALLPVEGRRPRLRPISLLLSVLLSLLMAIGLARPDWTERIESRWGFLEPSYAAQAGGRERAVSSTSSWSQRFREYQSMESFVAQIRREWTQEAPPQWLLSDDYGLAAQLLAAWPLPECRMFLPEDGIFSASWPEGSLPRDARVLVLSVRGGRDAAWLDGETIVWSDPVGHPVDSSLIAVGTRRRPSP